MLVVVLALMGCAALPASAKDLNVLTRVLYAAFFVEQGAAMCSVPSVALSDTDRALFINTKNYAQWIKQKVSVGLPADEVAFLLKAAADRAKGEMDEVIKVLKLYPSDREIAELTLWCKTKMTSFAEKIVGGYAREREKVDEIIRKAKEG